MSSHITTWRRGVEARWPHGKCPGFESSGLGSSPDQGHGVVFLGKIHFTPAVALFTQVYRWVPANLMLVVALRWSNSPRECRNITKQKPG